MSTLDDDAVASALGGLGWEREGDELVKTVQRKDFAQAMRFVNAVAESAYGEYEGMTTPHIREQSPGWLLWRDGAPGGETAWEVGARADRVLKDLARLDGDAAVFSHGHFLRVLAVRWLGLAPGDGRLLGPLGPACLGVLGREREDHVVSAWNLAPARPD